MVGSTDYPLSGEGIKQAMELGRELASVRFARAFVSPLSRARQTAELILGPQYEPAGLEEVEAFREISLGQWEGLSKKVIGQKYPRLWAERGAKPESVAPPDGENFLQLAARVNPVFTIVSQSPGDNLLVVAHRAVNLVILAGERQVPLSEVWSEQWPYGAFRVLERA
jgi:probable phosphoglycerate mutase